MSKASRKPIEQSVFNFGKASANESDKKAHPDPEPVVGVGKASASKIEETITPGQIVTPSLDDLTIIIPVSKFDGTIDRKRVTGTMPGLYTQDQPFYFNIGDKKIPCMRCFIEPVDNAFYLFYWRKVHYNPTVFKTPIGNRSISLCQYNSATRGQFAKWLKDNINPFDTHVRGFPPGFNVDTFWDKTKTPIKEDEKIVFRIMPMHDFFYIYPPEFGDRFNILPYNNISVINLNKPEYLELFTNHERFCEIEPIRPPAHSKHYTLMPPPPPPIPPHTRKDTKHTVATNHVQTPAKVEATKRERPAAKISRETSPEISTETAVTKKTKKSNSVKSEKAGGSKRRKRKTKKRKQKKL